MLGQIVYAATKVWIFAFPVIWHLWFDPQPISLSPIRGGGLVPGAISGAVIAIAVFASYWFVGRHVVNAAMLRDEAARNGLDQPLRYLISALTLTFVNSLLEEFVWRWFVYRQCERLLPAWPAMIASASMFTLHHLFPLRTQVGWMPSLLACGGIFIGGMAWSWLYRRYRSLWPGYVSHVLADAAVFAVGWIMLFG
jgi:membrane protease YdiL (CAAX protease family)